MTQNKKLLDAIINEMIKTGWFDGVPEEKRDAAIQIVRYGSTHDLERPGEPEHPFRGIHWNLPKGQDATGMFESLIDREKLDSFVSEHLETCNDGYTITLLPIENGIRISCSITCCKCGICNNIGIV